MNIFKVFILKIIIQSLPIQFNSKGGKKNRNFRKLFFPKLPIKQLFQKKKKKQRGNAVGQES